MLLAESSTEDMLGYWENKLTGPLTLLDLPTDKPRPVVRTHEGGVCRFTVPAALARDLRDRAAAEGLTPYMLMLSAYGILLHRYTGQPEVLIGSPATLRDVPEFQEVVGYLVNTIVTRHEFASATPLREHHRAVRRDVLDSLRNKHAPLDEVIERLRPQRSTSHPPIFQTLFTMPEPMPATFERLGLPMDVCVSGNEHAKYDLSLLVEARADDDGYEATLEYDASLFERATVEAMGRHFMTVLDQLVTAPDSTVDEVHLLDAAEEDAELDRVTEPYRPMSRPVTDLVREQVERTPDEVAVVGERSSLTYRDLDRRANQLAHELRSRGVRAGDRVGIYLGRHPDMIVGVLGVLRSGAAYVPIDPAYPSARVAYALHDSHARLVLTESALDVDLPDGIEVLSLDTASTDLDARPDEDLGTVKDPNDEIYVIYTSGSTGDPKGVVLADATVTNLVQYQMDVTNVGAGDRTLQFMSLSFDVSIQEILGTLCAGGTLVVVPEELRSDFEGLAELIQRERVARAYFPYIALQQLAAVCTASGTRLDTLREVVSTGEQLVISQQIRDFFTAHPHTLLWNMYGPSETHVASAHPLPPKVDRWPDAAPIGRPLPGFSMVVLDPSGNLVPAGVAGELHLGGPFLSPGYNRLPDETAARFLTWGDTASGRRATTADPERRLYRTGDLARRRPDGVFEYLGRTDDQVKIRGHRVEPSEVEAAVNGLDSVDACAVAAVPFNDAEKRLVAFLVADGAMSGGNLRSSLRELLPDYMVPSHVVTLDALPTTPSGKIDRKALPALFTPPREPVSAEPRTDLEREIVEEWVAVLGINGIGVDDDFFETGGHSLLATRLVSALRQRFGIEVSLREVLARPTVAGMAAVVEARRGDTGSTRRPNTAQHPDLAAEVRLPSTVGPATDIDEVDAGTLTQEARDVLLTGATGFLGSYLLRDLLACTDARIHCLVRAGSKEEARRRLRAAAERYRLAHDLDIERVVPVPGDVSRPRLGLDEAAYADLVERVGAVYHAAAHINFVAPYSSVKATNVDGMAAVLELCAAADRPVPLHHASTKAVFSPEHKGVIDEASVPDQEHERLRIGYTQSKWVAEQMAHAARVHGFPVSIFRIGRVAGDSVTGACQADDYFWRQIKSYIQLGSAPPGDSMTTDLLPVDFVSRALVLLSRQQGSAGVFHLFHPKPVDYDLVYAAIGALGFPLEIVEEQEWLRRLERAAEHGDENALTAAGPLLREGALEIGDNVYANERTTHALRCVGLEPPEITVEPLTRMIEYFRQEGELDCPGPS